MSAMRLPVVAVKVDATGVVDPPESLPFKAMWLFSAFSSCTMSALQAAVFACSRCLAYATVAIAAAARRGHLSDERHERADLCLPGPAAGVLRYCNLGAIPV